MNVELETWLRDGDDFIIQKRAENGANALAEPGRTGYWMWLIDYSVRNSGTFDPLGHQ